MPHFCINGDLLTQRMQKLTFYIVGLGRSSTFQCRRSNLFQVSY